MSNITIPSNILLYSYKRLIDILNKNGYSITEDEKSITLNKDSIYINSISKIDIDKLLKKEKHITYSINISYYNKYKDSNRYSDKVKEVKSKIDIIIYIHGIKYLCNELNKTNKIFNLT